MECVAQDRPSGGEEIAAMAQKEEGNLRIERSANLSAMCTYNGARFLPEQLESVAAQTSLPDELVICDDRSTDESVEIHKVVFDRAPFAVRLEINDSNLVNKEF